MRKDKLKALELRKQGKSYKEIGTLLQTPKTTLSGWFKGLAWSQELRHKLNKQNSVAVPWRLEKLKKIIKAKWEKWYEESRNEAIREFDTLKAEPLFLAGIMLYWAEGDRQKKNCIVRLGNSDPEMIKLFYQFLLGPLNIPKEKIRAALILYPDLIDTVQKNFWSRTTHISLDCFKKSVFIRGKNPKRRLSYGICTIYVPSGQLKEKILTWIEMYQSYFDAKEYNLAK